MSQSSSFAAGSSSAATFNSSDFLADHEDDGSARVLLVRYWHAALRRRWIILAVLLVCLAGGVIKTVLQPAQYAATSQIEINRGKKNVTNVQGVESAVDVYDAEFYETQYALLKTSALAERVARKLNLGASPDFFVGHGMKAPPMATAAQRKNAEKSAASILLGGITVSPIRNSSLVKISYSCRSAQWAARIANAWPQEHIAANMDREYASNADARRFLEAMLADLRGKVEQSEGKLLQFAADHNMVKLGGGRDAEGRSEDPRTLVESDLEALNSALLVARTERIAAESRLSSTQSTSTTDSGASSLRAKRAELGAQYARLLVSFDPKYPAARAMKAEMDALDAAIEREVRRTSGGNRAAYLEAVKREAELNSQVQGLKGQLNEQQQNNIQYSIYQREADTNRQLYDAMLQRYKEVGIAGSVGSSNIGMVESAAVPGGPSSPSPQRNLMLALIIGLVLSALIVFALEQIDERVRDPSEVDRKLGMPLLGSAPKTDGDPITDLTNVKSELSEAYFSIRTVLAFATSHGLPSSLVVTSARPHEGKSTTALALAMTIGRTGKRVLLIDADIRAPTLHRIAGCSNNAGLSNHLAGDDNFTAYIATTEIRGLSILPSGPQPPSVAELLGSERLSVVVERFGQYFDCLVIDGPPILGLADAPLLARAVEGCVFVVEADKTGVAVVRNAVRRLRAVGSNVFGVVVTKFMSDRYGYGYDYGYKTETAAAAA